MTDSSSYLARPGQPLGEHLEGVAANAATLVPNEARTPRDESLHALVQTVAQLHDIGKLTPAFQQYIREERNRPPTPSEYHAAPGAILTFHALASQQFSPATATAGFYAVLQHHQALPNVEDVHPDWRADFGNYDGLGRKLQGIERSAREQASERLEVVTDGALSWDDIHIDDPAQYADWFPSVPFGDDFDKFYPLVQRVWSTLTCADKLDAADAPLAPRTERPDPDQIGFESEAAGIERELNELRSEAQQSVSEALSSVESGSSGVFTLTLPTGFGKTFAGLKAALQRAGETGGRVVYALPYTTILDQVDDAVREQFAVSPASEQYTLHHHLADTRTAVADNNESVSDGTETLYGESWQAGLLLTTTVQLFESLAGSANLQSIKLPALQDAVIIVDEPQVLPREWWRLITHLFDVLTDRYDATVILMTATQPRFVDQSSVPLNPTELVANPGRYFEFLADNERVIFDIDDSIPLGTDSQSSPVEPETAGRRLVEQTCANGGATLSIANTVQNATELSETVRDSARDRSLNVLNLGAVLESYTADNTERVVAQLEGEDDIEELAGELVDEIRERCVEQDVNLLTASLTAALRPSDRVLLIETISSLLDVSSDETPGCPVLVTSTQLVEAGVDLSFDRVYRDFAPVPNLAQAAGRCNRSFETDCGRVVLWRLSSPEHDRLPSELIYTRSGDRLTPTTVALENVGGEAGTVPEFAMITDGVETYYDALHDRDHREHGHDELVIAHERARGETLREASLIDDHSEEVLVVRTEAEREVLTEYLTAKTAGTLQAGKEAMATLQQLFASVPEDRAVTIDESEAVVDELGFDADLLEEFAVVLDLARSRYDLRNGSGLRRTDRLI